MVDVEGVARFDGFVAPRAVERAAVLHDQLDVVAFPGQRAAVVGAVGQEFVHVAAGHGRFLGSVRGAVFGDEVFLSGVEFVVLRQIVVRLDLLGEQAPFVDGQGFHPHGQLLEFLPEVGFDHEAAFAVLGLRDDDGPVLVQLPLAHGFVEQVPFTSAGVADGLLDGLLNLRQCVVEPVVEFLGQVAAGAGGAEFVHQEVAVGWLCFAGDVGVPFFDERGHFFAERHVLAEFTVPVVAVALDDGVVREAERPVVGDPVCAERAEGDGQAAVGVVQVGVAVDDVVDRPEQGNLVGVLLFVVLQDRADDRAGGLHGKSPKS